MSPLDKDKTNGKEELRRLCPNCYYPLPNFGGFCSHCGQKYTDGKLTFFSLVREFLSGILNFENRMWSTLPALFIPGKLTKAFFKGRQQRYVSPLRLFFITAIIFFAVVSYWGDEFAQSTISSMLDEQSKDTYYSSFIEELKTTSDSLVLDWPDSKQAAPVLDSLYHRLHDDYIDSLELGVELDFLLNGLNDIEGTEDIQAFKIAKTDIASMPVDTILAKYAADKSYGERLIVRQNIRFYKDGEAYVGFLTSKLIWMMLLMMPLLALILKMLYIRRGYYYVEHLIFSFHTHAFMFIVMAILFISTGVINPIHLSDQARSTLHFDMLSKIAGIAIPVYFFMAMRRVYGQSRRKTFAKIFILLFFYLLLFCLASILTFVITAIVF